MYRSCIEVIKQVKLEYNNKIITNSDNTNWEIWKIINETRLIK